MFVRKRVWAWVCPAALALCVISLPLVAEHGRNFAGEFQVRDVIEGVPVVKFQLHVKIFNYSGADVNGAIVALADRRPGPSRNAIDYQGSFTNVSIPYRRSIELDGSFTVPAREYQRWKRGTVPYLVVTYVGESGNELRNPVELQAATRRGLPREESR